MEFKSELMFNRETKFQSKISSNETLNQKLKEVLRNMIYSNQYVEVLIVRRCFGKAYWRCWKIFTMQKEILRNHLVILTNCQNLLNDFSSSYDVRSMRFGLWRFCLNGKSVHDEMQSDFLERMMHCIVYLRRFWTKF